MQTKCEPRKQTSRQQFYRERRKVAVSPIWEVRGLALRTLSSTSSRPDQINITPSTAMFAGLLLHFAPCICVN